MTPAMSTSLDAPPKGRAGRWQFVSSPQAAGRPAPHTKRSHQTPETSRLRKSHRDVRRHGVRWTVGFLIASALVTCVAPQFLSSLRVYEWSDELDDHIIRPGYVHRNRDEGWSKTHYGPYGLHNAAGLDRSAGPTVLIWGDSYVEAHQVDDDQKMDHHVTKALSQHRTGPTRAVAVGRAYWSIADYYFFLPRYERLFRPTCHFIVLAEDGLKDLCPDGKTFLVEPTYAFVERTIVDAKKSQVIADLYESGLSDAVLAPWKAVRTVMKNVRISRFTLGPVPRAEPEDPVDTEAVLFAAATPQHLIESWAYAVDKLTSVTDTPIVFVLVPELPVLKDGRVCFHDPQTPWRTSLVKLLADKHVACIDMTDILIEDYRRTGRFSRGFHHGRPDHGHFNARGHRLVAQQICAYLDEQACGE